MKQLPNLQRTKVYVFSDSVLCLGKVHQHPESNEAWKKRIEGVMTDKSYRDYDGINGESTEFEWNIFPGFKTLQLCGKVNDLLSDLGEAPETFTGRILFMSMFNDISCDRKGCWNSQKADIIFSAQRLHCPGVYSRAKDMENCQYTSLQIIRKLKLFFE